MTDLVLPADDVAQLDLAASKVRHALDSLQATAADDLSLSGKVPKKAFHAFATAQEGRVAVAEHITALQQALLPTSTAIVTAAVAYLQHVAQDSDAFAALAKSGQLSKQCTLIANALQCAQQGYEALGTDMLELQRALQQAKKKMHMDLQAAHTHLGLKIARRKAQQLAAAIGAVLLPPLALLVGSLAGAMAADEAQDMADAAYKRAKQQLARTGQLVAYCNDTHAQLQEAIDLVIDTKCVVDLAGFFASLAAAANRAGRTAESVEARSADSQSRAYMALHTALVKQLRNVTTSGEPFAAVMHKLSAGREDKATLGWKNLAMNPVFRMVARDAHQLREALRIGQ